ncbi:glycosyltransferase family 2 protein [Sulfitobacter sp.]|uniref:glycosyltransferase family 2 protein n=1 Tax=Sulfitobacter sp. TaxID=1903071 RepID=UPI00356279EC
MPLFSIIIPCFNAETTILETLASLSMQSCSDWEAICIDDGSTDNTPLLIKTAASQDARIRLVRSPGKGPSTARNTGVTAHAQADLIAFCDADDLWQPHKLAELALVFQDTSIDGVFGQVAFFRETPSASCVVSTVPTQDLSIDVLLGENPVCTMSNLTLRTQAFARCGGFDDTIVHNEDLEFLIRLVGGGARIVPSPSLQTWYRTSVGGLSTDLDAMLQGRSQAIATAAKFDVTPSRASHAIHHRYLARRALRVDAGRTKALHHAIIGIAHSPGGFMSPARRGTLTLGAAIAAAVLPRKLRLSLFS